MGLSPESISKFMQSDAVQQEVDKILDERGVLQNLSGDELRRARQSVLNGIYDGIVYQESVKPYSDQGVLTAAQQLQRDNMEFQRAISGYERVGNEWRYNGDRDLERQRIEAQANARVVNRGNPNILGQSDANNTGSSNQTIRIAWNGNNYEQPRYLSGDETAQGISLSYSELPEQQRALVKQLVGSGNENFYTYYYERPNNTGLFSDVIDSSAGTIYAVPINIAGPSNTGGNAATTPNTTSGSTSINGTDDSDHMDLGGR